MYFSPKLSGETIDILSMKPIFGNMSKYHESIETNQALNLTKPHISHISRQHSLLTFDSKHSCYGVFIRNVDVGFKLVACGSPFAA